MVADYAPFESAFDTAEPGQGQGWWLGEGEHVNQYMVVVEHERFGVLITVLELVLGQEGMIVSKIPNDVLIVLGTERTIQEIEQKIDAVLTIVPYKPQYKLSPELASLLSPDTPMVNIHDKFEGAEQGYAILQVYLIEVDDIQNLNYGKMEDILENKLVQICGQECEWKRYGTHHVWIEVGMSRLQEVVNAVAGLQFVHWIDVQERVQVFNFFANSIVQVGTVGITERERPYWDIGVTGEGQVVGVGDTGLDYDSCFFRDANLTTPGAMHRKVVDYRIMGDGLDGSGHGTHVCGSILGKSIIAGKAENHNGIAPGARITFTDLGEGEDKYLKLPQEGMEQYYGWSYERGARTHSDSWGGGPNGGYRYTSRDADRFMWDNMDFTAVLAAGNEGETYGQEATIGSLAACKNAIAVGSTLGPFGTPDIQGTAVLFQVTSPEDSNDIIKVVQAEFGPGFESLAINQEGYVVETTVPADGCVEDGTVLESETKGELLVNKIALISRGGCKYLDKVLAAQAAGAVAVFVYNTVENPYGYSSMAIPKTMIEEGAKIKIPAANLANQVGNQLLRINSRAQLRMKLSNQQIIMDRVPRFDNIAAFSSFGPTDDNRVKPDIVSPGEAIRSAYGDRNLASEQCQTAQLTGTSMSTPIIAGSILLIRQYYEDGYYPDGVRNPENAFLPTSALIKATLLNGAVELQGVTETGLPLEPAPSMQQGWGRVNLATTLAHPESTFTLWAEQNNSLALNQNHKYCIQIPEQINNFFPLSVTLVWTDYPAELQQVTITLVNDLDLKVISPPGFPRSTRGPAPDPDRRNNVEKEIVRSPVPGSSYMVLVSGYDIKQVKQETGGQPYALVVTAPKGTIVEQCEECFECPSPRPIGSTTILFEAPISLAQEDDIVTMAASSPSTDDPCACSNTGIDLGTLVDTGLKGCGQHGQAEGESMRSCYVVDSKGCGDGAIPSVVIEGVAWRECNVFEELYSSNAQWEDPKPGTSPQYIQNEISVVPEDSSPTRQEEPLLVVSPEIQPTVQLGQSPVQQTPQESDITGTPTSTIALPSATSTPTTVLPTTTTQTVQPTQFSPIPNVDAPFVQVFVPSSTVVLTPTMSLEPSEEDKELARSVVP